jgi:hypothetical protein
MTQLFKTSNFEKYKLIALCIKAFTGIIGGSLILSENHPYLTITILGIGAVANEMVSYIKDRERK